MMNDTLDMRMNEERPMTRAERLRLTNDDYHRDRFALSFKEALTDPDFGPPDNTYGQLRQLMSNGALAFIGSVLEDDMDGARHYASACVERTSDYFFGDWRNVKQRTLRYDGEPELRKKLSHAEEYLNAIRMCGILSDWTSAEQLSSYPDRSLCNKFGFEPDTDAYVYLLSSFFQGGFRIDDENEDLAFIRSRRSRNYKLLGTLARDVSERDSKALNKDLDSYLKYFKKSQFRKDIPRMLSLDGTFWISCSRHLGMAPEWSSEFDDFLVIL